MSSNILLTFAPGPNGNADQQRVLGQITRVLEEMGTRESWEQGMAFKVNLALEEISLNIMSYGGDPPSIAPAMAISIDSNEDRVTIEVADAGRPFNPLRDAPPVPIISPTQDAPTGGLGIHLVRNMVDDLSYHHDGARNRLTITAERATAQ